MLITGNLFDDGFSVVGSFVVRVFWREELQSFARIISEHTLLYTVGAVVAPFHGELGVRSWVFAFAYLHDSTTAVPTVGWVVFIPERIGSRQSRAY